MKRLYTEDDIATPEGAILSSIIRKKLLPVIKLWSEEGDYSYMDIYNIINQSVKLDIKFLKMNRKD